jgi:hypothetical protein
MRETAKHAGKNGNNKSPQHHSSQGNSPVEMVPKDVSPDDAAWKDRTERDLHAKDEAEKTDALLDEASDLSFPASDPIAVSSATKLVKDKDGKVHPAPEKPKGH